MSTGFDSRSETGFAVALSQQLRPVYAEIESRTGTAIPSSVRSLVEAVFVESVTLRREEWLERGRLDLDAPGMMSAALDRMANVAFDALAGVEPRNYGDIQYFPLQGVLEVIAQRWCDIYPFC